MCELLGLSFEKPISASVTFKEFSSGDQDNADGWGVCWYPDQSLAIVKEPRKWRESHYAQFLCDYPGVESRILMAHIRHKTRGGSPSHADTHPFGRELGGREYVFAHNGTLDERVWGLPLGPARPLGATDSEQVFCHILHEIAERGTGLDGETDWRWLQELVGELNKLGHLNFLMSDGTRLFCYHDIGGWKGLHFRKVRINDTTVRHFEDESLSLNIEGDFFNRGLVIASRPLSQATWHPFHKGQFMVMEAGMIRYSSHRNGADGAPLEVMAFGGNGQSERGT